MEGVVAFQMWEPHRQSLIRDHSFYVEQAQKRLLSQFTNIETEADQEADRWLRDNSKYFDPDRHDEGAFYEKSIEIGIEFCGLLSQMQEQTRLSVVAGMFHEWDKRLREWLVIEVEHWHWGTNAVAKIWSVDFDHIMDFLGCLNWNVRNKDYFRDLDMCRLIVNVYKHGEGASFQKLNDLYNKYLSDPFTDSGGHSLRTCYRDHTDLKVNNDQISTFSRAIVAFWRDIPEEVTFSEIKYFPKWFLKSRQNGQN